MKILKIIGVVAGLHALVLLVIFANPGCSSTSKPTATAAEPVKDAPAPAISLASYGTPTAPITASPISQDTAAAPAFNPDAPATGGAVRYSPTRPNSNAAVALETAPVADVMPASTYTVGKGDSLWTIAKKNHLPVADLAGANNLRPSATLHLGQKLVIPSKAGSTAPTASAPANEPVAATTAAAASTEPTPAPSEGGTTYTVKNGETLGAIARKLHVSIGKIAAANNLADPRMIRPGQSLVIPSRTETSKPKGSANRAPAATATNAPIQTIPTSNAPVDQDLDAGLKPATTGAVPVIKVEDGAVSAPKN